MLRTIRVWDLPVRITHWVNVLAILGLSITGYYIAQPFVITRGAAEPHFLMGWVRFLHLLLAFAFTVSVLFRLYWTFAGNHWAGWRQFLPIGRARLRGVNQQLAYYVFLRRTPPPQVGHNPLAGATYALVYVLFMVQVLTGFALYSVPFQGGFWHAVFGWLVLLLGIPVLRLVHFLVMWMIIAFTAHHVYSAVLIDIEERSGLVSSIFTGNKTLSDEHIAAATADDPAAGSALRG